MRVERQTRAPQPIDVGRGRRGFGACACVDDGGDIEAAHSHAHASSLEKLPLQHPGQRQRPSAPASQPLGSADAAGARFPPASTFVSTPPTGSQRAT